MHKYNEKEEKNHYISPIFKDNKNEVLFKPSVVDFMYVWLLLLF